MSEFRRYSLLLEKEFKKRGYEVERLGRLTFNVGPLRFSGPSAISDETQAICRNKVLTKEYTAGVVDSPEGYEIPVGESPELLLPFPLVVKPIDGSLAKGVHANIQSEEEFLEAVRTVHEMGRTALVEEYITGTKYRILASATHQISNLRYLDSVVVGNGRDRLSRLINEVSRNSNKKIEVDRTALKKQGVNKKTVPEEGQVVYLSYIAARASGAKCFEEGEAPQFDIALEIIRAIPGLVTAGIDIIRTKDGKWKLIEVNGRAYLRQHLAPDFGVPAPVVKLLVDAYIPFL
jgi:cyanophycin synthetase